MIVICYVCQTTIFWTKVGRDACISKVKSKFDLGYMNIIRYYLNIVNTNIL